MKGGSKDIQPPFRPWFQWDERESRQVRVIFGHWSALGLVREHGVVGLDTGCVWGGALTALDIDALDGEPVSQPCRGYQDIGE
jgi:bis(5'-nucleosyl)-tetraphosphatase (symmetrical)